VAQTKALDTMILANYVTDRVWPSQRIAWCGWSMVQWFSFRKGPLVFDMEHALFLWALPFGHDSEIPLAFFFWDNNSEMLEKRIFDVKLHRRIVSVYYPDNNNQIYAQNLLQNFGGTTTTEPNNYSGERVLGLSRVGETSPHA
jgi:hypothetical protein